MPFPIFDDNGAETGRRKWEEWNPDQFDAEEWVDLFLESGAQYFVYESFDDYGFSMSDSPATTLDSSATVWATDACKELAQAASGRMPYFWHQRQHGGIDFILGAWAQLKSRFTADCPDFAAFRKASLYHLLNTPERYGRCAGILFAGNCGGLVNGEHPAREGDYEYQYNQTNSTYLAGVYTHQPWMLMSKAFHLKGDLYYHPKIDFDRRKFRNYNTKIRADDGIKMSIFSLESDLDGWAGGRTQDSRTPAEIIKWITCAACRDANLVVRVTPNPKGQIEPHQQDTLRAIGDWMKIFGQSIYNTGNGPYLPGIWGGSVRRKNKIYLHITQNSEEGIYVFPQLPDSDSIASVTLLNNHSPVSYTNAGGEFRIDLDDAISQDRTVPDRVVLITYNIGYDTLAIDNLDGAKSTESLCAGAAVSASNTSVMKGIDRAPTVLVEPALDGNGNDGKYLEGSSFWSATEPFETEVPDLVYPVTVEVDMGSPTQLREFSLLEKHTRIRDWKIQYQQPSDQQWVTIYQGTDEPLQLFNYRLAQPVTTQFVRILITRCVGGAPQLRYIRVYNN